MPEATIHRLDEYDEPQEDADALLAELWADYVADRDPGLRDRLILHYAPLVKYVAGRVGSGLPAHVEQADLISYGTFGLIDAITRFEPTREVKFESYAMARIRGAIIDELRNTDWIPRSVRMKARAFERAVADLEAKFQRTPTEEEVADEMDMDVEEVRKFLGQLSLVNVVALDELLDRRRRVVRPASATRCRTPAPSTRRPWPSTARPASCWPAPSSSCPSARRSSSASTTSRGSPWPTSAGSSA